MQVVIGCQKKEEIGNIFFYPLEIKFNIMTDSYNVSAPIIIKEIIHYDYGSLGYEYNWWIEEFGG